MGAFDAVDNIEIPDDSNPEEAAAFRKQWKWEPHEKVIIRGSYSTADQEVVENASASLKKEGKKRDVEMRTGTARRKLLELMIIDWTLSYRGQPVPVSRENIGKLPINYRTPILERIDEITEGLTEEEQEDFLPSAAEPSETSS